MIFLVSTHPASVIAGTCIGLNPFKTVVDPVQTAQGE